jgi:lipopolysaccharide/colanic/teichoic acid biosynthesis glycosyltransferase
VEVKIHRETKTGSSPAGKGSGDYFKTPADRPRSLKPSIEVKNAWYEPIKRSVEFFAALFLLICFTPIILAAALLVKLTTRGPIFYSQMRVGRNGQLFSIYKIRSMVHNCEAFSGICWSGPGDKRITRMGKILRKTHVDELPQLVNVLLGHMSLVGPRPERPEFLHVLEQALEGYRDRVMIRPGITGLAQVQLPPDTDLSSVRRKLAYDLYYVECLSPWLDLRILVSTLFYALGVPFAILEKLFGLPGIETVERARK